MPQFIRLITTLCMVYAFVGCSMKPTDADAKRFIEQKIQTNSNGLVKLIDFKKTNGIDKEIQGQKLYKMEWVATIEFSDDCLINTTSFVAVRQPKGFEQFLHLDKKQAQKGTQIQIPGSTEFTKTENGWR